MMGENRPKHVELTWNNKLIYMVHLVGYFHSHTGLMTRISCDFLGQYSTDYSQMYTMPTSGTNIIMLEPRPI
jgi:hypothetical protein